MFVSFFSFCENEVGWILFQGFSITPSKGMELNKAHVFFGKKYEASRWMFPEIVVPPNHPF